MTNDSLPLAELLAKAGDGDFLRSVAEAVEMDPPRWTVPAELSLVLVVVRPPVSPSRSSHMRRWVCARLM
jgi:hypothetical protein